MKVLKVKCPHCGHEYANEIREDVTLVSPVAGLNTDGELLYDSPSDEWGGKEHYICTGCGAVLARSVEEFVDLYSADASSEELANTAVRIAQNRCGFCKACKELEHAKSVCTPNPPFSHADDATVMVWNRAVLENPCAIWTDGQKAVVREWIESLPEQLR